MKKSCRQRWRVNLFCFLVSSPVYCHNMSGHLFSFQLWRWENLVVARQNCVLFCFCLVYRDLSQSDTEQRRGDSAIVAGDRWRVHHCQLLGQTPGTTPPQHWNHWFFFKHEVPDIDRFVHWWCQWRCLEWGLCSRNMSFILLFLVWL